MQYTIGTIVSDWQQYDAMQKSFIASGFPQSECQYIAINNVGENRFCMYSGGNAILSQAAGDYIILVHQDVRAQFDDKTLLDKRLQELTQKDPTWAIAGNAGAAESGDWCVRITDRYGINQNKGYFPRQVNLIDGNFIIVKKSSMVAFSSDLSGFHYYGWDICLNADIRGYTSYVIDWHIAHLGDGEVNQHFHDCKKMFMDKWSKSLRSRKMGAFDHDAVHLIGNEN